MVARIEHERAEREALEQHRQELLKRKQKLISDNKKRANDLANLDTNLEKFIDVSAGGNRSARGQRRQDASTNVVCRRRNRFRSSLIMSFKSVFQATLAG